MLKRKNNSLLSTVEDDDPMSVVSNLFDVAMVFAVALMVALVTRYNMTDQASGVMPKCSAKMCAKYCAEG